MIILSIETSCDDTAIAIIEAKGGFKKPSFKVLSSLTHSQIELHAKWQGVVPSLAKREHSINLTPLLETSLQKAGLLKETKSKAPIPEELKTILEREPELLENLEILLPKIKTPKIDAIAVTYGPGLEPALWVGVSLAKALSICWKKPIIPVNHMEGHALSSLLESKSKVKSYKVIKFPAIALLVSGGHTELVLMKDWLKYKIIGSTRDDASGEAFDKVARIIGLTYPGGPQISKLAESFDPKNGTGIKFPRPMINSDDFDFSFSGLKTAVLYKAKELGQLTEELKKEIAYEFEQAVVDTLVSKTKKALIKFKAKSLILGGGVSANKKLRISTTEIVQKYFPETELLIPEISLSADNAGMIGVAGYFRSIKKKPVFSLSAIKKIKAEGNLLLK
ncbi:MAG: putative tRNA threonylcarbamoyladenosine biosynthesis protein Gcp [Parcubacteria group bacterium GW2011_GWF2_38_76]|nr:MAG: putative tRNA threonylcarbamoyladenosine biosynthesis protein Gcp [Parcubacteria group bacterium GW2011_GWF2_38_76]HBM45593.1 tRNA (adenosine(37)-N6)-threonylcarbamoyltransferase complex transferase subunit TsaD [Patescibacteria group bacterium]